jgi:aminoglycoside phosphotransferase family enzyme/predicted kinase
MEIRNYQEDKRVPGPNIAELSKSSTVNVDSGLVMSLLDPLAFPHPVESIEVIETHISWVILTGPFAYKIKKPVKLGFLDFRELRSRLFYCEEEVRLNRPWAPDIYLDVVPISLRAGQPIVGGDGPAIEYAVRMHQFDQDSRLDAQLDASKLSMGDMDELANTIASRHQSADIIGPDGRDENISLIKGAMSENLDALEGLISNNTLQTLRQWTTRELGKLEQKLEQRFDNGFVRECHGDLHLSNLVRLSTGITAFDCIEFSADFRKIDVMCDIAFLVMDLVSRRRSDLAYRFLNRYLELTGDYRSMEMFTLYFVYRCLVRAKVAAIRSVECKHGTHAKSNRSRVRKYCDMALTQTVTWTPVMVVMHGLSGSGKTWLSTKLMSTLPAVRINSDIERKRMFELDESEDSGSDVAEGIYTDAANKELYGRIHGIGATILRSRHDVILDASYLKFSEREHAREMAADCNAGIVFIQAHAPVKILRDRIYKRARNGKETSEADPAVLAHQLETAEPLTRKERRAAISWDSCEKTDTDDLIGRLRYRGSWPTTSR